jgi:hypothetical protein
VFAAIVDVLAIYVLGAIALPDVTILALDVTFFQTAELNVYIGDKISNVQSKQIIAV